MTPERAPRDEEGTVGRWQYWLCGCTPAHNQNVMLPSEPECRECGTVRPPLPEAPAPRVDAADARAQYVAAIERERDEALAAVGIPKPSPRFLTDAQVTGREPIAGVSEAMIDAAMRADRFGYAAISDTLPDLVAQTREWYRRILSAALRAVPVEGRPLAAAITDHPVSVEDAVKLLREAEQELSGGEGNHEILGAECGVMADRLAALATPTPSEDRPDAR